MRPIRFITQAGALAMALSFGPLNTQAQTPLKKTFDVRGLKQLNLSFIHPEMIKVSTGEAGVVLVEGTVSINNGENDDAFTLEANQDGQTLSIASKVAEGLPKMIMISKGEQRHYFKTNGSYRQAIEEFKAKEGTSWDHMQTGVITDITLHIKIPPNLPLNISARHGMIELLEVGGPVEASSRHGGVDIGLDGQGRYDIVARTRHGQAYSNIDLRYASPQSTHYTPRWETIVGQVNGGGTKVAIDSRHGNLYLRRK